MLKKIYSSIRPNSSRNTRPSDELAEQMAETDRALEAVRRRRELPTIPEVHVHVEREGQRQKPDQVPPWVKIAIALGAPALVAELIRRLLP